MQALKLDSKTFWFYRKSGLKTISEEVLQGSSLDSSSFFGLLKIYPSLALDDILLTLTLTNLGYLL